MSHDGNHLDLLLVHADDHAPVLERGLAWLEAARAPEPTARPQPEILWSDTADANDLASQRWGVIAPRGAEGDRLLELVAPLIERRRLQQGGRAVRIHRVPERMSLGEAVRWKKRAFRKGDDLGLDIPRYQLILGDFDQVPLAVQQVQATDGFVGRLAFDRADDYRAYVEKVLGWEDRPAPATAGQAILHTVHDGTPATRRGHAALMLPGHQILERRRGFGEVRAAALRLTGSHRPTPGELLAVAAGPGSSGGGPGVLLSLSHGLGAPRAGWQAAERQRREQGALSFGGGVLAGHDLAGRSFLPGGVWLAVACFGAGTTDTSDYYHWLDTLRRAGHVGNQIEHVLDTLAHGRPFVAALPRAALASPEGPLAFIGHVDLAWAYSFFELDDRPTRRPGRFMGVLRSLLHGDRAGAAMRALSNFFDEANTELTALYDEHARTGRPPLDDRARARRGHLWMLRQDLAGYVLLGDPAVRLPLGGAGPETTAETSAETGRVTDAGSAGPEAGGEAGAAGAHPEADAGADADSAEAAVRAVIAGLPVVAAASAHGLKRDQLERLVAIYGQAGRAAIERALRSRS